MFANDAPELRAVTEDFFVNYVEKRVYDVYISAVVMTEIDRTTDPLRRRQLGAAVFQYALREVEITAEAEQLAAEYVKWGVMRASHMDDARHVAVATYHEMDILLSWNFKHLANRKKQIGVKAVNERNGYFHPLLLMTPMEVLYEDS